MKSTYVPGDNEAQQAWHVDLYKETAKRQLLAGLEGGRTSAIYLKNDLKLAPGGTINFGLRSRMDEGFLPPGANVDGNEGKLNTYMQSVVIAEKNFGIKDAGSLSRQVTFFDLDEESKMALAEQAAENIDREYITALNASNTMIYYEGGSTKGATGTLATATAAVTAANKLSPEFMTNLKHFATNYRTNGFYPIRPINVDGEWMFILLTNGDSLADLENDATFIQGRGMALERSKKNPLFKGAYSVWNNIIVFSTDNGIQVGTNASSVKWVRSFLLGQQALCSAWARDGEIVFRDKDYGREHGFAYLSMWATQKSKFPTNSGSDMQYGVVDVVTARSAITDVTYA